MKCVILALAVLTVASAEVAVITKCENVAEEMCQISEVRITPCTLEKKNCLIKKGINTTLSFDYNPNFSASSLKTMVYYVQQPGSELPFAGIGSDNGCDYTPCPVEPGKTQQYNYNLYIGKKLPKGFFQLKWKVWNEANTDQACCFQTKIKIK